MNRPSTPPGGLGPRLHALAAAGKVKRAERLLARHAMGPTWGWSGGLIHEHERWIRAGAREYQRTQAPPKRVEDVLARLEEVERLLGDLAAGQDRLVPLSRLGAALGIGKAKAAQMAREAGIVNQIGERGGVVLLSDALDLFRKRPQPAPERPKRPRATRKPSRPVEPVQAAPDAPRPAPSIPRAGLWRGRD